MSEKDEPRIISFACGPSTRKCKCNCRESCEHVWDGEPIDLEGGGWSVTCSRCGLDACTHSLWTGP